MPNIPGLPPFESGTKRAHAPRLGEHTLEVLAQHGYSEAEIAALLEQQGGERAGTVDAGNEGGRCSRNCSAAIFRSMSILTGIVMLSLRGAQRRSMAQPGEPQCRGPGGRLLPRVKPGDRCAPRNDGTGERFHSGRKRSTSESGC